MAVSLDQPPFNRWVYNSMSSWYHIKLYITYSNTVSEAECISVIQGALVKALLDRLSFVLENNIFFSSFGWHCHRSGYWPVQFYLPLEVDQTTNSQVGHWICCLKLFSIYGSASFLSSLSCTFLQADSLYFFCSLVSCLLLSPTKNFNLWSAS